MERLEYLSGNKMGSLGPCCSGRDLANTSQIQIGLNSGNPHFTKIRIPRERVTVDCRHAMVGRHDVLRLQYPECSG
jgi:hypothetical protein